MSSQPPRGPDRPRPGGEGPSGTRSAGPGSPGRPPQDVGGDGSWTTGGTTAQGWQGDRRDGGGRGGRAARTAAVIAGAVAVTAAGASGGAWLARQGEPSARPVSTAPPTPTPETPRSPSGSASPTVPKDQPLSGVAQVDATAARAQAKQAGIAVLGRAVEAWTWTDTNGRNLLLTTKSVDKAEGTVTRAATLRIYHVAQFDTAPKVMLTPLRDSGVADCDVDFTLDFVQGSVKVTDTDGDGHGEASVGWASLCAGDPAPLRVKLALLTKGTYYILRGQGQRATDPLPPSGITFPKASFTPNLPRSRWPEGTYQQTVALFRTLFR